MGITQRPVSLLAENLVTFSRNINNILEHTWFHELLLFIVFIKEHKYEVDHFDNFIKY